MIKTLNISTLIPAFILAAFLMLSVFAAFPANAQIQESCKLTRDIKLSDVAADQFTKDQRVGPLSAAGTKVDGDTIIGHKKWGTVCLINTVNAVTDWAFFILISIAFVFILIAGFLWMTGRGEPEKQKQAANMIGAALVGIVIAILARVIPAVITGILT